ncbi:MAG: efflux transporter outer membrane subunit [Verrucomicrobiota bacterium]
MNRIVTGLMITLGTLICGCAVGPDYQSSEFGWNAPALAQSGEHFTEVAPDPRWWQSWDDEILETLIARGVRYNRDLRIAWANLNEARALRGLRQLDQLPTVTSQGSYQNSKTSENAFPTGIPIDTSQNDFFSLGFDATWELDLFGRVRRQVESAAAQSEAAVAAYADVMITTVSEIAREYTELRGLDDRLEIARRNVAIRQETLTVAENRMLAGIGEEFDVVRARSNLTLVEAVIPELQGEQQASLNRLSVLTGAMPGEISDLLEQRQGQITVPAEIAVGLSSNLLKRRPDIRQAEQLLAAATADVGVATADFFPRFIFTGEVKVDSLEIGSLLSSGSSAWSFGPGFSWAFLDLGRVIQRKRAADARLDRSIASYEQAVLVALEEAFSALARLEAEKQRSAKLAESVTSSRKALELAQIRYQEGLDDILSVLDVERQLLVAEEQFSLSRTRQGTRLIALYKTLGGLNLDELKTESLYTAN